MKKKTPLLLSALLVGASVAIAACGSSQTPDDSRVEAANKPDKHRMMNHDGADKCPMKVEGTTARAEDAEGAATVVFSTTGDVDELRRRVAMMAEMHTKHQGEGHMAGMHKAKAGGHDHSKHRPAADRPDGAAMMKMPASSARSEEMETGARIVLTPKDPADLEKLRAHALHMTEKMSSGDCQMMAPQSDDGGATHKHPGAN